MTDLHPSRCRIKCAGIAPVLAAVLLIPAMAADAAAPAARRSTPAQPKGNLESIPAAPVDELETVVVEGEQLVEDERVIMAWMRRLVGQFSIQGAVVPIGEADAATNHAIQGRGLCTGFNPTPAVSCEIRLQLPDPRAFNASMPVDLSPLSVAVILYGHERGEGGWHIRHMLVDRNGNADPQLGALSGDTLISRSPCVGVPGGCRKVTRITAQPDGSRVDMQVQIEVDGAQAMAYAVSMTRVDRLPTNPSPGGL